MKIFKCNINGTIEKLVAAKSKKEAANKMNISYKHFLKYGHETGAKKDCELALNNPGKVFKKEITGHYEWIQEIFEGSL
jgi:3-hydroxy-3-methylglutaryl CoA synthase